MAIFGKIKFSVILAVGVIQIYASAQVLELTPEASLLKKNVMNHCTGCHVQTKTNPISYLPQFGDFSLAGVINRYSGIGSVNSSVLYNLVENNLMPPNGKEYWRGRESEKKEMLESIKGWINKGASLLEPERPQGRISEIEIIKIIAQDLKNEKEPKDIRYISLLHLQNNPRLKVRIKKVQEAVAKLVNSLSWNPQLVKPIFAERTGLILKIKLSDYKWSAEKWKKLEAAYPYPTDYWNLPGIERASLTEILKSTNSQVPIVRADWLVNALASPPLYNEFIELPKKDTELESRLGININRNISDASNVIRIGFAVSGVSQHNRMIERHQSEQTGYYWKSYDFDDDTGNKDVRKNPLGPDGSSRTFKHGGGEIIFSLPNGMQGYMLTDSKGNRIDEAPIEIVSDIEQPNRAVLNGVSCMRCHAEGLIRKADQVNTADNLRNFTEKDAEKVKALYRTELVSKAFELDIGRFNKAIAELGIVGAEPIRDAVSVYNSPIYKKQLLVELGIDDAKAKDIIQRFPLGSANSGVSQGLSYLIARSERGLKRATVEKSFATTQFLIIQDYEQLAVPDFLKLLIKQYLITGNGTLKYAGSSEAPPKKPKVQREEFPNAGWYTDGRCRVELSNGELEIVSDVVCEKIHGEFR